MSIRRMQEIKEENGLQLCCSDIWGRILNYLMHLGEYLRVFYMINCSQIWKEGASNGVKLLVLDEKFLSSTNTFRFNWFQSVYALKLIFTLKCDDINTYLNANAVLSNIIVNHNDNDTSLSSKITHLHLVDQTNDMVFTKKMFTTHFNQIKSLTVEGSVGFDLLSLPKSFKELLHFKFDVPLKHLPSFPGNIDMKDVFASFDPCTIVEDTFNQGYTRFVKRTGLSKFTDKYVYDNEMVYYIYDGYITKGKKDGHAKVMILDKNWSVDRTIVNVHYSEGLAPPFFMDCKMYYSNGDFYQGTLNKYFNPDGKGHFIMKNDDSFKGEFKNGNLRHGTRIFKGSHSYDGHFDKNSQFHGHAKIHFFIRNETVHVEFIHGKPLETIQVYYADGRIYTGEHGQFFRPDGKGTLIMKNGDSFTGTFANTKPYSGIYTTKDKQDVFFGSFKNYPIIDGTHYIRQHYKDEKEEDKTSIIDLTKILDNK